MGFYGNPSGGFGMPKTFVLTDSNGNEFTGVVTGEKTVFTAIANTDIRAGKIAATSDGIVTGAKDIPGYHTTSGVCAVPANSEFQIIINGGNYYDYTELQAMTMPFNSSMDESVAVDRVVFNDKVYNVGSTDVVANVIKDDANKAISLGITNGNTPAVIRFITYKEEL